MTDLPKEDRDLIERGSKAAQEELHARYMTVRATGLPSDARAFSDYLDRALKACPFCQDEVTVISGRVHCCSCGASGPKVKLSLGEERDGRLSHDQSQYPEIYANVVAWNKYTQHLAAARSEGSARAPVVDEGIMAKWDSLNIAIARMLTSNPERMTRDAETLESRCSAFQEAIKSAALGASQ